MNVGVAIDAQNASSKWCIDNFLNLEIIPETENDKLLQCFKLFNKDNLILVIGKCGKLLQDWDNYIFNDINVIKRCLLLYNEFIDEVTLYKSFVDDNKTLKSGNRYVLKRSLQRNNLIVEEMDVSEYYDKNGINLDYEAAADDDDTIRYSEETLEQCNIANKVFKYDLTNYLNSSNLINNHSKYDNDEMEIVNNYNSLKVVNIFDPSKKPSPSAVPPPENSSSPWSSVRSKNRRRRNRRKH
ncbi:uncharacterized protein SCDLUD_003515 [Saccharomycodes ludwigii]|uniref:uncharacterized protein n=1 Tax=Saccharomycodes ludwigii TaxID=36035 RepID=UPI001E827DC5|nr:hypothetical protein SCDLUD_003515 [Saccharomycodes ludwigii]KAH3900528.1 hypothetical protein SCDLUD_003515 [Saccharomycodes ludwigii]